MRMNHLTAAFTWTALAFAASCAPTVPTTFEVSVPSLAGPVLALAGERDQVVAATPGGLFSRSASDGWVPLQVPGLTAPGKVACLALQDGELFIGTRGEGLHILSGQTWEVRNERYGGLPDDDVLSLAVDREGEGLPGTLVWVGTATGLAVRREGSWQVFKPGKRWLWDLVGAQRRREGKAYLTPGFRIGDPDEDGPGFKAPVRSIGVGMDRVVLGGDDRLAILGEGRYAAVLLDPEHTVNAIRVEEGTLWLGTSGGLVWGGLMGAAQGEPYPSWRPPLGMSGILFGSGDSRAFHYNLRQFGFNLAEVKGISRDSEGGLWVAFSGGSLTVPEGPISNSSGREEITRTTTVRRYANVDQYIAASERPHYEVYGKAQGVAGSPTSMVYIGPEHGLWLGTTRGIVNLK